MLVIGRMATLTLDSFITPLISSDMPETKDMVFPARDQRWNSILSTFFSAEA